MADKKKHAFKRLVEVSQEVVGEVDRRLLAGDTPSSVAAWLHELGHFQNLKPGSLKKNLERYRAVDLKDRVIRTLTTATAGKAVSKLKARLNAVDELEELVKIQKGRLHKVLMKETELPEGILLKQASDEARLLKEQLVELGKLQLETGVLQRVPKKVSGSLTAPDGTVQQFEWTEEQDALFKQLEALEGRDYAVVEDEVSPASVEPADVS